jgi:hypothetical protein
MALLLIILTVVGLLGVIVWRAISRDDPVEMARRRRKRYAETRGSRGDDDSSFSINFLDPQDPFF